VVDAPNSPDPQQPAVPVAVERPAGFLASTTGKLVLGGIALVVVLVVIGAIAWAFLFNTPSSAPTGQGSSSTPQPGVSATKAAPTSQTAPIVEPQEQPLESTFVFRNVFAPTLKAPTPASDIASALASTTSSSEEKVDVPKNTLYLSSIQTVDGKKTATFTWNGETYTLSEGETIKNTPWKVVEIGDSSVVMLYGDSQVTLATGQGLTK